MQLVCFASSRRPAVDDHSEAFFWPLARQSTYWGGGDRRVGCHVRTQGKQNNAKEGGNVRDGEMSDSL